MIWCVKRKISRGEKRYCYVYKGRARAERVSAGRVERTGRSGNRSCVARDPGCNSDDPLAQKGATARQKGHERGKTSN